MTTKTLITYGTFDLFHIGHLRLLKRLKEQCDFLIVGVSTDEFNRRKGKESLIPFEQRSEIVQAIEYVDMAIAEKDWEQKLVDINKYNVDIFVMGDDWKGEFDFLKKHCEVIYLPRTKNISTTQLKKSLSSFLSIPKEDIINALKVIETLNKDLS